MEQKKPNIIVIYADDLGFGDLGCYGATEIPTPNIDKLAAQGVRFHNGYATAATCTPSRYSLLTGSYPWRNPRAAILAGDAPTLIPKDMPTLPRMLQNQGYKTSIVGKWHLGLGTEEKPVDWNTQIEGTPRDIGFDTSYIMAATNDRVPCVFIRDKHVENLDTNDPITVIYDTKGNPFPELPTGKDNRELLTMEHSHGHNNTIVNGVGRIGYMKGGTSALWDDETMGETFLNEAIACVSEQHDQPFFLYYALHQPHVPRIPNPKFRGATKLGPRGDVIVELDWCVGELMNALDKQGIRENTIVIFSSDNGPVLDDGYKDQARELSKNHSPTGPLRGGKYSLFDGGTRVPFILSWPGTVTPGESENMVCHMDFYASFAALTGYSLEQNEAPDSENVLEALLAPSKERYETGRKELVTEGTQGNTLLRQKDWIYISPHVGASRCRTTNIELGNSLFKQLYNIQNDIGQQENVARGNKEHISSMDKRLKEIMESERTREV